MFQSELEEKNAKPQPLSLRGGKRRRDMGVEKARRKRGGERDKDKGRRYNRHRGTKAPVSRRYYEPVTQLDCFYVFWTFLC